MTRVPGLSLEQLDRLGDDYAALVSEALAATARAATVGSTLTETVEDLGLLRGAWSAYVAQQLLPALGVAFEVGAAQVRVGVRDAITSVDVESGPGAP